MIVPRIDLLWIGDVDTAPRWSLGSIYVVSDGPADVAAGFDRILERAETDAVLTWDSSLGVPDGRKVQEAFARPGDVWHSGLRLGLGGKPEIIDFVAGTWMLNCDPHPDIEATSWRLSLRACLIRTDVLRQMGHIRSGFNGLDAAGLEMGHRYIARGVIVRHIPWLASRDLEPQEPRISVEDELRFAYLRFGANWMRWAACRAILTRTFPIWPTIAATRRILAAPLPQDPPPFRRNQPSPALPAEPRVTVLIPTIDRYPYLEVLLQNLRTQTVKPAEIIVVDQTRPERRRTDLVDRFTDLPLRIIYQDEPGQCSSRNAGLQMSTGGYVAFLDDDIEAQDTLIEDHLNNLARFRADASSGVATEVRAGPLPNDFQMVRVSDVFPAGNTLIRRGMLDRSGLFDLAYNHGSRADGDLGMRVYQSGAVMVLNPAISVLHHHAPQGGLRTHKARIVTYASSRSSIFQRHLPSVTEIYQARRYFTARQVTEMQWQRVLGTFSVRGGAVRKVLKAIVSAILLPATLWEIYTRSQDAQQMLQRFPRIPPLHDAKCESTCEVL